MTARPLLQIDCLSVRYRRRGQELRALDDVSFSLSRGEILGVVGESGSGKSTLGRAILGLAPIHAGSVRFDGRDITHLSFKNRRNTYRRIQVIFQDPYSSLNPSRTIGQSLAEPLESYSHADRRTVRTRVDEILRRVHLPEDAASRYPSNFSGGQRQRIAIARALMLEPDLVICDEPVSALDLAVQAQVLNLLQEIQRDVDLSYLFISHDLDVVRHLCDRIVVMYQGQIMEIGSTRQVIENPSHPYTSALHDASPLPHPGEQRRKRQRIQSRARTTLSDGDSEPGVGCRFVSRCPYARETCSHKRPLLGETDDGGLVACHQYPGWRPQRAAEAAGNDIGIIDVAIGNEKGMRGRS